MILLDSHTTPAGDTMTPNFLRVGDRQQRGDAAFSELPQKQIVGLELMLNADRPKRMGMCSVPSAILSHCRVWRAWLAEVKARAKVGCGEPLDTSRRLCGGGTGMRLQQRAGQLFRLGWCVWSGTFYLESVSLHPSCPRKFTVATPLSWPFWEGFWNWTESSGREGGQRCPGTRARDSNFGI